MKKKLLLLIVLINMITITTKAQMFQYSSYAAALEDINLENVIIIGNQTQITNPGQTWEQIQYIITQLNILYQNNPSFGGCNGNGASWDQCGVCGGNGSTCAPPPPPVVDCAGVQNGSATNDPNCGCIGGTTGILACPPICNATTNSNFAASGGATIVEGAFSVSINSDPLLFGLTYPERVNVDISACSDGSSWKAVLTSFTAEYSYQTRMRPLVINISGTTYTNQYNFCAQANDLKATTHAAQQYYNLNAVKAHEDIHKSRFQPALNQAIAEIESYFETYLSVAYTGQTEQAAIQQIKNLNAWNAAKTFAYNTWKAQCEFGVLTDHGTAQNGPAYIAERQITDPIRVSICALASSNSWGFCSGCY
jgi:hypothetical protein